MDPKGVLMTNISPPTNICVLLIDWLNLSKDEVTSLAYKIRYNW